MFDHVKTAVCCMPDAGESGPLWRRDPTEVVLVPGQQSDK